MSTSLAIAAVTATLAHVVRSAVQADRSDADVVVGRYEPARSDQSLPRVSIWLYHLAHQAARRNVAPPRVRPAGRQPSRTAALELSYLFSFYGNESDFQAHRMLGAVIRAFHVSPILTPQTIREVVAGQRALCGSDLGEADEQIKLIPIDLSLDNLSKLRAGYIHTAPAVSIAYKASPVLIAF